MKAVLAFVAMLVALFASPDAPAASSRAGFVKALDAKTVALVAMREDTAHAYCTGVWVGRDLIMTAVHCIDDEPGLVLYSSSSDVYGPDGVTERESVNTHLAMIDTLDEDHDVALLRAIDAGSHPIAQIATGPIRQGDHVHTFGMPRGLWFSYSSGDIAAIRWMPINAMPGLWIQSTAPISAGNSGGGLFDDRGRLIGIAHAQVPTGQNLNFYVHRDYLEILLRRATS